MRKEAPALQQLSPGAAPNKEVKPKATTTNDKTKDSLDASKTDQLTTTITSDKVAKSGSHSSSSSSSHRTKHSKKCDEEKSTVSPKSEDRKFSSSKPSYGSRAKNSGDHRDRSGGSSSSSRSSERSSNASRASKKDESSKSTSEKRKRSRDNGDATTSAPSPSSLTSGTSSSTRTTPSSKTNVSDFSAKVSGTIDDDDFVDFEVRCPNVSAAAKQGLSSEVVNGASNGDGGAGVDCDAVGASTGGEQPPKRRRVVTLDTSSDEDL